MSFYNATTQNNHETDTVQYLELYIANVSIKDKAVDRIMRCSFGLTQHDEARKKTSITITCVT